MIARITTIAALISMVPIAHAQDVVGIPLKTDPAFGLDGDLGDWGAVPGEFAYDAAEQVVHGAGAWTGTDDLGGRVKLAWRQSHLYLSADVTDDQLQQTQQGDGIWQGDHIEFFIDAATDLEPERAAFGDGQFQIAFSPGNFLDTGDALIDCAPEAYCFRPRAKSVDQIDVSAQKTADGWTLEAAIPWSFLAIGTPAKGTVLAFEVALSDTDSPEARQESFMTSSSERWTHTRGRLILAALAGTDGVAPPISRETAIADAAEIQQGETQTFAFEAPETPEGRDAVVTLNARLHSAKVAGHTYALKLSLNGESLGGERLLNRPRQLKARSGSIFPAGSAGGFRVFYAPDYDSPERDQHYGLIDDVKACRFELDVSDIIQAGENELVITNSARETVTNPLHVGEVALAFRMPPPPEREKAGPPEGPLATIEPDTTPVDFTVTEGDDSMLTVDVGGKSFRIESRFSMPKPEWVTGGNDYFTHERAVDKVGEAVIVRDTFSNLTDDDLGIMQRHEVTVEGGVERAWIAGTERYGGTGQESLPANPTSFGTAGGVGIGLLPTSDATRIHATNYARDGQIGLADSHLVIPAGAEYSAEWAIVPTDEPDYYSFINVARRLLDVNFEIDGGFAFLRTDPLTEAWSDEQIESFIRFKDAKYVCTSITYPRYNGINPHGTAFQQVTHDNFTQGIERWRRLVPEAVSLIYFHCFIDVTEDGPERFADSRLLRPDGEQGDYGKEALRLYTPTDENSYGKAVGGNVDIILDKIGADGVYWDEHEYSAYGYHYGDPWDGVSGDIDPTTLAVRRRKSSVTLISESWRVNMAKRIMANNPLLGNGPAVTRAMMALKFPCFIETGTITHCRRGHLYSPIALGDHLTERSERDAYYQMLAALEYGCVYHWYNDMTVIPTHHHLTRYMFPITPMALRKGTIIGEERIITKVSGKFGWGDDSAHEVHVFNDDGVEVDDFNAPLVTENGKTYTELRIAEDWSAAIIRQER